MAVWIRSARRPNDPGGDVTNNKLALLVFYGLVIASAVIWFSLAAMA